jgi:hypothetical protein
VNHYGAYAYEIDSYTSLFSGALTHDCGWGRDARTTISREASFKANVRQAIVGNNEGERD